MRILVLTQYYPPEVGAPQTRLHEMSRELRRQGHEVSVLTAMPNYPAGSIFAGYRGRVLLREELDGVPVWRTWIYPATGKSITKRLFCYFSFVVSAFLALFKEGRPDYIFVESPPLFLGLTAYLGALIHRCKFIFNVSDLWPDSAKAIGFVSNPVFISAAERLERFLYAKAAVVNAVSEGIAFGITSKGVPQEKVHFFPNGVNTGMFQRREVDDALRSHFGLIGKKTFVFAGTHGYAQGLEVVLDAACLLQRRVDIAILMVGEGPVKAQLQITARDRGLTNVVFADGRPIVEMPEIFSMSIGSIVPLRRVELFQGVRPSKIFPALATGCPVIFSGEGEAAKVIENANCGIVVEPENAGHLAQAIVRMAEDPEFVQTMAKNGRQLVEEHYTWAGIIDRWLKQVGASGTKDTGGLPNATGH